MARLGLAESSMANTLASVVQRAPFDRLMLLHLCVGKLNESFRSEGDQVQFSWLAFEFLQAQNALHPSQLPTRPDGLIDAEIEPCLAHFISLPPRPQVCFAAIKRVARVPLIIGHDLDRSRSNLYSNAPKPKRLKGGPATYRTGYDKPTLSVH